MANTRLYKKGNLYFVKEDGVAETIYFIKIEIKIYDSFLKIRDADYNNADRTWKVPFTDALDEFGVLIGDKSAIELYVSELTTVVTSLTTASSNASGNPVIDLATNDLGRTAWGIPKFSLDYSLFHGMWSLSVPNRVWLQYNDIGAGFVEQGAVDNTLVKSVNGMLFVGGDATTDIRLSSKRHLRYQPNRGLLFSTALAMPNPTKIEKRRFGLKTNGSNGIVFELEGDGTNWTLNLIKITTVDGVVSEIKTDITDKLPPGFDPALGPVYDIQMQWRGFGDYVFYISLNEVYIMDMIDTLTHVSISNPALSVTFESTDNLTPSAGMFVGCVDVTSEGGSNENKLPNSIDTGTTLLTTTNAGTAILALKLPTTILYNGNQEPYTRDLVIKKLSTFCKDEAFRSVYYARLIDTPNLDAITWQTGNDSGYQYAVNSAGALDTAFQLDKASMNLVYAIRGEKDIAIEHNFSPEGSAPRYLSGGDILILELKSDNNSTGGATLEFDEEM